MSGTEKGNFIFPDTIPASYNITYNSINNYNWQIADHSSIQFKYIPKKIAVFRSKLETDGHSINWEAIYFKSLFETFLDKKMYYFVNEDDLNGKNLSDSTEMLIIPSFNVHAKGDKHYIDSLFTLYPGIKNAVKSLLSKGGTVYTEGNAAYFLQKSEISTLGTIDFTDVLTSALNEVTLTSFSATNPIALASTANSNKIYTGSIPKINSSEIENIANLASDNRPVIFALTGSKANGGKIICNLALPTVGGVSEFESGSRQLQWTFNTILYAFSKKIDVTRSVYNVLPPAVLVGDNAVSYDRIDTFEVRVQVRNLSSTVISNISVSENFRGYFSFIDIITPGVTGNISNGVLNITLPSLAAHSEQIISYRVATPEPDNTVHENVDKLIDYATFVAVSQNTTEYSDADGTQKFVKRRNYADIMFSARIFGDTDLNWKNFLGIYYQPFKVFMIMENKERTQADNTVYVQYIPKDVPFYWTDTSIHVPILKTPGGKYVDILKGSNDENNPEYDMDSDGDPDVWLDTASIYPKGYQITEEKVYWANPWEHLRTGNKKYVFEDIDHDGIIAEDTDGDGVPDINLDEGDKIRVWKITWDIGTVKGYEYFDPYCSLEVWVDPPDLIGMAAGVAKKKGKLKRDVGGMFYPYTPNINDADTINNTGWKHWMENNGRDTVQFINQKFNNYLGYIYNDTATTHYKLKLGDEVIGTTPMPHNEFIAVLSLGGEEIDMRNPLPSQSLYSKINYKTIFNEERETPTRTTYTYYAPLPNPLQFEYLASNFSISDTLGKQIDHLPAKGKALIQYDIDASTEYSYYWIRNYGHDVDYNDPSLSTEGEESLGDGVFGYIIYEIPKGMGGYRITLPKKADGSYDIDSIVKIEGKPFTKWLDNPNTANAVEIWESPFTYQIYIPQVLIPPALDDNNFDGVDDWIDDRGDRFESSTGYLHDAFMLGNGEDYPNDPGTSNPFDDFGYRNNITKGWYKGADNTFGDDLWETLGKTHFTINAIYEGRGREGNVDISKGGTLVVEEIFGGSPWVIFSHVLTSFAQGVDYKITSSVSPVNVKYGIDTVFIKHEIEDINEPHDFDANFDPYHCSYSYGNATVTSIAGGKDPCSLVERNGKEFSTSTIIDPTKDVATVTLVPLAGSISSPDVVGYPKTVTGTYLEVKIEVTNSTEDNWLNTSIKPVLTGLGNTKVEMSYNVNPRPLVPAHGSGDNIVPGDQPGTFTTGWRFNQPEGEVLIKMGDTLNLMQPTRRGYFIFLIKIDENLKKGIYEIGFTMSGTRKNYKGTNNGNVNYAVPPVKFSIVDKDASGKPVAFQKMFIDKGELTYLKVNGTEYFAGLNDTKWSSQNVTYADFNNIAGTVAATYSDSVETIDLSKLKTLPNADSAKMYILEKIVVNSYKAGENIDITTGEILEYSSAAGADIAIGNKLSVSPYGPRIHIRQTLYSVNGVRVEDSIHLESDNDKTWIVTKLDAINLGSDVSKNTIVSVYPGPFYTVLADSLASNVTYANGLINANLGLLVPGGTKSAFIYYEINQTLTDAEDFMTVIKLSNIGYEGTVTNAKFNYPDTSKVLFEVFDLQLQNITSQKLSDTEYSITATAVNRGLPAKNVWLRIYPVIGDGINEFPIKEMKIENFLTNQEISLAVDNYFTPSSERIQIYAKIDDGDDIRELMEVNNSKIQLLREAVDINELKDELRFEVYPNPFVENVRFAYSLKVNASEISIDIYSAKGQKIIKFTNCPLNVGTHTIDWAPSNLPAGNYIYKLSIKTSEGKKIEVPGILIKTN
jgi:hypothetical protein